MSRLGALGLIIGAFLASEVALASIYVPGQYKDGIYIRPHFLPGPVRVLGHQGSPLDLEKGMPGSVPAKPALLEDAPPAKKLAPESPS